MLNTANGPGYPLTALSITTQFARPSSLELRSMQRRAPPSVFLRGGDDRQNAAAAEEKDRHDAQRDEDASATGPRRRRPLFASPMILLSLNLLLSCRNGNGGGAPFFRAATAFSPVLTPAARPLTSRRLQTLLRGWLRDFFEPPSESSKSNKQPREARYPEQYPATYGASTVRLEEDSVLEEARLVRPLLKGTQLESRPLRVAYDASSSGADGIGWDARSFHRAVDGKGAAVVLARAEGGRYFGGYNPKGWSSLGGARPSVAAFVFYEADAEAPTTVTSIAARPLFFQKLRKVGGGGLACARDDPDYGISFGPDALVVPLLAEADDDASSTARVAYSKLGPYYERSPHGGGDQQQQERNSLFSPASGRGGAAVELVDLKVLVGVYGDGEDVPYAGGVLDMTSG